MRTTTSSSNPVEIPHLACLLPFASLITMMIQNVLLLSKSVAAFTATAPPLTTRQPVPTAVPTNFNSFWKLHETTTASEEEQEETKEDVAIRSTTDVPSLPPEAIVDVYYVETSIDALGILGEVIEGYHVGLVFETRDTYEDVPPQFTIEWYAVNFPFGAFLPQVLNATSTTNPVGLQWDNSAGAFYIPRLVPDRWDKGKTPVGSMDGKAYAEYIQWVVEYRDQKPGYQAFEVWDRPQLEPQATRRWVESTTCSSFAEESLQEMWRLGGEIFSPDQILRRSYLPIISKRPAQIVDSSDPALCEELRNFYVELNKAARGGGEEGQKKLTTSEFIRLLGDRLEVFYVYDTPTDTYRRVELSPPYFALANLYQPMSLPWQLVDIKGNGELVDIGAFASSWGDYEEEEPQPFSKELADAAESIGELLGRRLPTVLSNKVDSRVTFGASILAVLFFAAIIDQSFVVGVLFGLALGQFGPGLLTQAAKASSKLDE